MIECNTGMPTERLARMACRRTRAVRTRASIRRLMTGLLGMSLVGLTACTSQPAPADPAWVQSTPALGTGPATSEVEARRVDRVQPKLTWDKCGTAECGSVRLPLDYDEPDGTMIELSLTRVKVKDRKNRIGTLFVNPGGPAVPATGFALQAPDFFSKRVLARYDIVGIEPRGVGGRNVLRCFTSQDGLSQAMQGSVSTFPYSASEETAAVRTAKAVGRACSTTGKELAGAMSTAEVARDMDVLRRALGDEKLSFYGKSYGSFLGQVYANMFPDRIRSVVIDGVIDPRRWTGAAGSPDLDPGAAAEGAYRALTEIFTRCDKAGRVACPIAGNAARTFDELAQRLRTRSVTVDEPGYGRIAVGYDDLVANVLNSLYLPQGADDIVRTVQRYRAAARTSPAAAEPNPPTAQAGSGPASDYPGEGRYGVTCTDMDSRPTDAADFPALAAQADRKTPYFGRLWTWTYSVCASATWTVQDEDAYRGPFDRRTSEPVLVVGNYWDPATNYSGAKAVAGLLPNSRLLTSDNWGHTAYRFSPCVKSAVDAYLIQKALPADGTVCKENPQPFA
ncbi:alpha/beta hydrolase [Actinoplanes cyaneus]|nr:alpha/beta hydrolase [Actinoplanes cyaneus]